MKKLDKRFFYDRKYVILFLLLTLLVTGFIFSNSMKNIEDSTSDSNVLIEFVRPIFELVVDTDTIDMHFVIRKCAHLTEFAALGFFSWLLLNEIKKRYVMTYYGCGFLYGLLVAVTDEYIQSFFERTSSVSDILIDFAGYIIGIVMALMCVALFKKWLNWKEK